MVSQIVPYKLDDSGLLVNSFTFATKKNAETASSKVRGAVSAAYWIDLPIYVDLTANVYAYISKSGSANGWAYCGQYGCAGKWNSNNPLISVSSFKVSLEINGPLYIAPDVISASDPSPYLVGTGYYLNTEFTQYYPTKNQTYWCFSPAMPSNRLVQLNEPYFGIGWLEMGIYYWVDRVYHYVYDGTDPYLEAIPD